MVEEKRGFKTWLRRKDRHYTEAVRIILNYYEFSAPIYGVVVLVGCEFEVQEVRSDLPEVSTLDGFCKIVKSRP